MWYAIQSITIGCTAYIYLSEVSNERDVGHALFLGFVMAFFVTLVLTELIDLKTRLIRSNKATLLRLPLNSRGSQKPDQSLTIRNR